MAIYGLISLALTALREAAKEYVNTLESHRKNPRDVKSMVAWDEATSAVSSLINNDEINIIVMLFTQLEAAQARIAELESEQAPVSVYQCRHALCNEDSGDMEWYWDDCDKGFYEQYTPEYRRILYTAPPKTVVNLNHIGRATLQLSGQRYTYWSAEDVRCYFEEMKCQIVERTSPTGDAVYVPHTELPKPVIKLSNR